MSLKAFHVFFILMAVLCGAFSGAWAVREYGATHDAGLLVMAIVCFVMTAATLIYGVWFLRTKKHLSYI